MRKAVGGAASARNTSGSKQPAVRPAARPAVAASAKRSPVTRLGAKPAVAPARLALVRQSTLPSPVPSRPQPVQATPAVKAPPAPPAQPANPFMTTLLAKRRELTGNLEDTKFDTLAKMGRVAEDDQAQMSHEEFISLQRNSMDYNALRQVNAAIERINTGDYGVCAACDEPISEKRLKAIPWAKYCVICQDRVQAKGSDALLDNEESDGESW